MLNSSSTYNKISATLWKIRAPPKVVIFSWLVLMNVILMWNNLQMRGWSGPSTCMLCSRENKNIKHMFITCRYAQKTWELTASLGGIANSNINHDNKCGRMS